MILAVVDATALWVAIIGAVAVLGAAWLPTRRTRRDLERRIGEPNGHGPVHQVLKLLVDGQSRIEHRLDDHERMIAGHEVTDEQRFAELRDEIRNAKD